MTDPRAPTEGTAEGFDDAGIERAIAILRGGGLVVFPTETVYGLGANALDAGAVWLVYETKGRPSSNPLIVHVAGTAAAAALVTRWPASAQKLADRFWPGPLTIVLDRAETVPAIVSAGGPTIAIRCPDHPLTLELLRRLKLPLVGPSANASGTVSPTRAEHVRAWLGETVEILDGGPCERGIESTVVRIEGGRAVILRPGVITRDQIAEVVEVDSFEPADAEPDQGPLASPGMLRRHYAPRTPTRLFDRSQRRAVLDRLLTGDDVIILTSGMVVEHKRVIQMPDEPNAYARELYAALHRADAAGARAILIEVPDGESQVWNAIRDRLRRASAG